MFDTHPGEFIALLTALCWTSTVVFFELAGRRVGALVVNLFRLVIAFGILMLFNRLRLGQALPLDADSHAWFWLSLSGLAGFVIGDLSLFRAFILIGGRLSMLIYATVPLFTALMGWVALGEVLSGRHWLGMALVMSGVGWVVLERRRDEQGQRMRLSLPWLGISLALLGSLGQALGLVLSKHGMGSLDAFAATQIRIVAGMAGFALVFTGWRWWPKAKAALADRKALGLIGGGAFFGPFLGVSLSLLAIRYTETGVAATIMSLIPVFILVPARLIFKEQVSMRAIAGACIAVLGTALMFAA